MWAYVALNVVPEGPCPSPKGPNCPNMGSIYIYTYIYTYVYVYVGSFRAD